MEREGGESMCPFGSRVELKHAKNMLFQDIELEQNTPVITAISGKGVTVADIIVSSCCSVFSAFIMIK